MACANVQHLCNLWERDQVAIMRQKIKDLKLEKTPGWNSIEISGLIHTFLVFDQSHVMSREIPKCLEYVKEDMRV